LHIAWYGFHHADQAITYELGVGMTQGADDVYGFKEVGFDEKDKAAQTVFSRLAVDTLSKMVTTVTLQPFTVQAVKINCIANSIHI